MKFTVTWMPRAQNKLAEVWMTAPDRAAVTAASYRLDKRLADDPLDEGESRAGIERITFEPPLQVLFRVYEADCRVEVFSVGVYGRV